MVAEKALISTPFNEVPITLPTRRDEVLSILPTRPIDDCIATDIRRNKRLV